MTYYPLKLSDKGIDFIKKEEFFVNHAYADSVGKITLGYGSTKHADGSPIKMGDTITEQQASDLLTLDATRKANAVSAFIRNPLNQNQQDSVISLCYNIGVGGFVKSTVLRMINQNQNDPDIRIAWCLWDKARIGGILKVLPGLTARRAREVSVYFTPII